MKCYAIVAWICLLALNLSAAELPPQYQSLKAEAEKLYGEGSFAKANQVYGSVNSTNLPPAEQRWVEFRLADTQWRSAAATETADTTQLDAARRQLEALVRDISRTEDRDRVWAEVQESLGDFFWTRRDQQ
ncbi:MAG: hypothetical protein ACTHLW_03640, partial [Verrucomicrobiota bacterium]